MEIYKKNKVYRLKNKDKINKYYNNRYKNDYEYKFKCNIRTMIRMSFKRKGKKGDFTQILQRKDTNGNSKDFRNKSGTNIKN